MSSQQFHFLSPLRLLVYPKTIAWAVAYSLPGHIAKVSKELRMRGFHFGYRNDFGEEREIEESREGKKIGDVEGVIGRIAKVVAMF